MARKRSHDEILALARSAFGFDQLRPGQRSAIESVTGGADTLVVQPTGSGKSAIYQIAGLMIEGTTVVISPLIALQKDQVDSINVQNAAEAVVVNSAQRAAEARDVAERIEAGSVEYIFLAPEQLRKQETIERLERASVSLFVVDEAHCVSQWGHDFRPDYLHIRPVIERLGHPTTLALTATASPDVRAEIVERLGMVNPRIFVHGFDRPNIFLRVDHYPSENEKLDALAHHVRWASKPGIVYVATRKNAEQIRDALREQSVSALFYHGGMKPSDRERIQERFMAGKSEVIVATNAFGMGVDKPDIRFVYHYDISDSLDAYYQEIGRAGRDGEASDAILFYRPENAGAARFRAGEGALNAEEVRRVLKALTEAGQPLPIAEAAKNCGLSERKILTIIHRLEEAGAARVLPEGGAVIEPGADPDPTVALAVERQQRQREMKRTRLDKMNEYANAAACRRQLILTYFGDESIENCDACDNCRGKGAPLNEQFEGGTRREVA